MAPSAGSSALRVEFHDVGLHRHPSRPRARPASVPAPRAPILEAQRRCRAPARALNLPPPFPESGSRFGSPPARRIARCTLPTKLVGYRRIPPIRRSVARPPPRSRTLPGRIQRRPRCAPSDDDWKPNVIAQRQNAVRVMQRGDTSAGEDAAISDLQHLTGDGPRSVERE
jgi:hypothetical protein